jgi:acetyltransferase-like isoleucine patch superfamily enzyme
VRIESNVWIGLRALVLKGVHVGADSVVGAAAVVREDVPARSVVVGNPAHVVKRFDA